MALPTTRDTRLVDICISMGGNGLRKMSTILLETVPPQISWMREIALWRAQSVAIGSNPRSKQKEESLLNPWLLAARRVTVGLKLAASIKTSVVCIVTPASRPPMTPPMHSGVNLLSQTITSCPVNLRSTPSSVVKSVPSGRCTTRNLLSTILLASKACSGWPISWSTKLVTSTTALIGLCPMLCSRSLSQSGLSTQCIPRIVTPWYLGHTSAETSTSTWIAGAERSIVSDSL